VLDKQEEVRDPHLLTMGRPHFLLEATVKGQLVKILFDTGSMASCLVTSQFVEMHRLSTSPMTMPVTIQFGNGTKGAFHLKTKFNFYLRGHKFPVEAMVLSHSSHGIIIGDPWMKSYAVKMCYFTQTFSCTTHMRGRHRVEITVTMPTISYPTKPTMASVSNDPRFTLMTAKQFIKECTAEGQEDVVIWTPTTHVLAAVVEPPQGSAKKTLTFAERVAQSLPRTDHYGEKLRHILLQYEGVFPEDLPDELPPLREGTVETVRLMPDAQPTSRPLFAIPLQRKRK